MGVVTPAPNVLGMCSLTAAVEMVCLVNLCVSIVAISSVDSAHAMTVSGVDISPEMQCITAAWFLIGIPLSVYAGVGALYRVESHLNVYAIYLIGTIIVLLFWVCVLLKYSSGCNTFQPTSPLQPATFACGAAHALTIFWLLVGVLFVIFALYLIWSKRDWIQKRFETDLIRYQEPWQMVASLADDVAAEEARELTMANPKISGAVMPAVAIPGWKGIGNPYATIPSQGTPKY